MNQNLTRALPVKDESHRLLPVTAGCPDFRSADVGVFRVSDTRFPPGLRLEPHGHERTSFGVILEGSVEVVLARRTHTCVSGTVETKPAQERHANRFGQTGARVLVVEPAPDAADLLEPAAGLLEAPQCFADPLAVTIALRLAAEIDMRDDLALLAIEGLVLELLVHCTRRADRPAGSGPPGWLREVREVLMQEFREPLRVAAVARAVGIHPAYVARRFREHFGTTMAGYVRILRLEWAARQLTDGDASIATVAAQAGFTDQSSLTRAFRSHLGTTPAELRRNARQAPATPLPEC